MNLLLGMVSGADGKLSTMRISAMLIVLAVVGVFVAENIVGMVKGTDQFISISWEMVSLVSAVLGVKAYQHRNEVIGSNNNNGRDDDDDTSPADVKEPVTPTAIVPPPAPAAILPVPGVSAPVSKEAKVISTVEKIGDMLEKK